MKLERVALKGFRCFDYEGVEMIFREDVTALVGGNGAGKTAMLQALVRLFGTTTAARSLKKSDFHLSKQSDLESGARLSIDVVLGFPDLAEDGPIGDAVPEFFMQMAASAPDTPLKVRIVLRATWINDGSPDGVIEEEIKWVRSLEPDYDWEVDCQKVAAIQRSSIQLIYVPATRNVHDQVGALLRGRLWQAARWSEGFRDSAEESASDLQDEFQDEGPARLVQERIRARWQQVHDGDTDSAPILRLIDRSFGEFIRKADFAFSPNEEGKEKPVSELSDGQRSLFHVALTAATLEIEAAIFNQPPEDSDFDQERLHRTHLTILAVEEPENSLSPFFLSRIVKLSREIGGMNTAQVLISSHSPAILGRIEAEDVRYFRRDPAARRSRVRPILLPEKDDEARSYVRLAVRAYPELYFARFVILGEGESEKLVIPFVAEALGVDLDPSFVPIVPLGGRYCGHFWRLLSDLGIPYATLLDYDIGREHGGANMIRSIAGNLGSIGENLSETSPVENGKISEEDLEDLTDEDLWVAPDDKHWVHALQEKAIFLSDPLDLDFSMLKAFPEEYQVDNPGGRGPRNGPNAIANAKRATLKKNGDPSLYQDSFDETFRWYSYLFVSGSKPDNHLSSLGRINKEGVREKAPDSLIRLVEHVADALNLKVGQ